MYSKTKMTLPPLIEFKMLKLFALMIRMIEIKQTEQLLTHVSSIPAKRNGP